MTKLVIVESPAKAKTIAGVLGPGFTVRASLGHVRDLPDKELGIDLEHGFKPVYQTLPGKFDVLKDLRNRLAGATELYLATDPDREGEAIAWHLQQALAPKVKTVRVMFHAITPADIQAAFDHPRSLDMNLVNAQQARRVLDRLVGYQVSPLLWKSTGGKSAGRVQSVALRLVVEREREIRNFVPVEYWTIQADLAEQNDHARHFLVRLIQIGSQKVGLDQAIPIKAKEDAERIIADLQGAVYHVKDIKRERKSRKPWPPFTTSTLQQSASARLHMSPNETMKIAQELYEGIDIGEGQPVGLITYMRTDSTAISPEAQAAARKMLEETLGAKYLPESAPQYKTKVKNAQEAHEAIRPTEVRRYPNNLKSRLSERQFQLYDLIWRRFVASQMAPAIYDMTTVNVLGTAQGKPPYLFRATGRALIFDGFLRVWQEAEEKSEDAWRPAGSLGESREWADDEPQTLPELVSNELLDLLALIPRQHFTQPLGRYTESALVKALEERGIGRPSTYAAIIKTLKDREYAVLEKRVLSPTALGEATCDALIAAFPEVMDYQFTAQVEDWLDDVSRGERDWVQALQSFYEPFAQALQAAPTKMAAFAGAASLPSSTGSHAASRPKARRRRSKARPSAAKPSSAATANQGPVCPKCSGSMVQRTGPRGRFWGCANYPNCRGTRELVAEQKA